MRHVKVAADRIRQGVHGRHRRVREGHAGEHCPLQHRAACGEVTAIVQHAAQIVRQQQERTNGQAIGEMILFQLRGIRLDGMHHGVDTRHGRHP